MFSNVHLQGNLHQRTSPTKLEEETLKFIRQKRPKLQCRGTKERGAGSRPGRGEHHAIDILNNM